MVLDIPGAGLGVERSVADAASEEEEVVYFALLSFCEG
jgi:hypothetical protein